MTPPMTHHSEPAREAVARREEQLRIQALGAALSRREWWEVEQAYNRIRDEFDRRPASPAPAAGGLEAAVRRAKYLLDRIEHDDGIGIGEFGTMLRMVIALAAPAATSGDREFTSLRIAYKRGVAWAMENPGANSSWVEKAAYDYADKATSEPPPAPAVESAQVKEAEQERGRLAKLVESMIKEPTFAKSPHARMAIAVAASNVRRGRLLTSSEKFDNLTSAIEEDDPDLANRLRAIAKEPGSDA